MISRNYWLNKIKKTWEKVPIVWLSGVRRSGKTTITREFDDALYLNCDLPSTHALLQNPELFYQSTSKSIIVFDEIHQLPDPSLILKIGADAYNHFRILATGSSTLAATEKFSDSLTHRKLAIHLVPVLPIELADFGIKDIKERLLKGGLPPALLSPTVDYEFYSEWMDSFFARDIQELFRVEKRAEFLRLVELLIRNNGGLTEVNSLSKYSGLSAPTVNNYIQNLETTHVIHRLRPFFKGSKREILKQSKCYAFDTGFVCYYNSWQTLGTKELGLLLENLVLETLQSLPGIKDIHFWRDKDRHEIDFVCIRYNGSIDTIECKWDPDSFNIKNLQKFRQLYPKGKDFVVSSQVAPAHIKEFKDRRIIFTSIYEFGEVFTNSILAPF